MVLMIGTWILNLGLFSLSHNSYIKVIEMWIGTQILIGNDIVDLTDVSKISWLQIPVGE